MTRKMRACFKTKREKLINEMMSHVSYTMRGFSHLGVMPQEWEFSLSHREGFSGPHNYKRCFVIEITVGWRGSPYEFNYLYNYLT